MKTHIKFVFGAIVALAIFSAAVMLLWNALVPEIFGLAAISFWQALGLLVLARLFFSGFGGGFGRGHGRKCSGEFEKNHIRDRWIKMTPEERKEFVKKHRHLGGFGGFGRGFENHQFDTNDEPEKQD
jgi:hypothetical protein